MHVSVESPQRGLRVLRPVGQLDMSTVPDFRRTLEAEVQQATGGVIIVLEGVTFMDSSGVAVLIEGLKWCRQRALPYVLAQLPPAVRMVIELAHLEQVFQLAETVQEATAMVTGTS